MHNNIVIIAGSILAVLLQIILAPNIAVLGAHPDFILVFVGIVAMLCQDDKSLVLGFVLGLVFDLLSTNAVGSMAALLVLISYLNRRAFMVFGHGSLGAPLVVSMLSCLLVEFLYGCFLMAMGSAVTFPDAFLLRILPCALYDCAIALILYPLLSRLLQPTESYDIPVSKNPTTIRLR